MAQSRRGNGRLAHGRSYATRAHNENLLANNAAAHTYASALTQRRACRATSKRMAEQRRAFIIALVDIVANSSHHSATACGTYAHPLYPLSLHFSRNTVLCTYTLACFYLAHRAHAICVDILRVFETFGARSISTSR